MKVREIIETLQAMYDPDDAVVIAWWDQNSFSEAHDMDEGEWAKATEYMDEVDWGVAHDTLSYALDEYLSMEENV